MFLLPSISLSSFSVRFIVFILLDKIFFIWLHITQIMMYNDLGCVESGNNNNNDNNNNSNNNNNNNNNNLSI